MLEMLCACQWYLTGPDYVYFTAYSHSPNLWHCIVFLYMFPTLFPPLFPTKRCTLSFITPGADASMKMFTVNHVVLFTTVIK